MNEWLNEWTDGQTDGQANKWKGGQLTERSRGSLYLVLEHRSLYPTMAKIYSQLLSLNTARGLGTRFALVEPTKA